MILSHIQMWRDKLCFFPEPLNKALAFIENPVVSELAVGKYPIIGDQIFCLIQECTTQVAKNIAPESHHQYIDIQYLIHGDEYIGHTFKFNQKPSIDKTPEQDILFYQHIEDESWLHLTPGMFAVFFPHDIHRPCCHQKHPIVIKKAVLKIDLQLLSS
jgi:biofilm protein TabA